MDKIGVPVKKKSEIRQQIESRGDVLILPSLKNCWLMAVLHGLDIYGEYDLILQ